MSESPIKKVSATISAAPPLAGTWTDTIMPKTREGEDGYVSVSVYGAAAWVATVYLQRSHDSGVTWKDVTSFTANEENALIELETGVQYRIGVKNLGWTSGSVTVRLGK